MGGKGSTAGTASSHRRRTWLVAGVVLLTIGLLALGSFLSWHFSSKVLVPDYSSWSEEVNIEAIERGRIVLDRSETTMRPGYYGLIWPGGHAVVGPILSSSTDVVTRRLDDVRGYLEVGTEAGFEGYVYVGNPREATGLRFRTVGVPGRLGRMPAWLVPGRTRTWAIVVHGHNGDRQIGLRIAPALHRAGLPTLLISYRNDPGAPTSPDSLYHLGLTEWQDVEAAARYALAHRAKRLVLIGYSMGGALIGRYMERSSLAEKTAALILDAPVTDWRETLAFNAREMGLPSIASLPLRWAVGARIDVDWEALDLESHLEDFDLPILLFHGTDDDLVPIKTSEDFARALPNWTTYFAVPEAGHVQSWNIAPALYEQRLRRFLEKALETVRARPDGSGSKK
jgi:uncharacterized protein